MGEPQRVQQALELIAGLYRIEAQLRKAGAEAAAILATHRKESAPIVDPFFDRMRERLQEPEMLPTSPLARALGVSSIFR